jgi:putative flavoprotein involved in K+ transport
MKNIKPEYDIVIVGAGHSGLCLSYILEKNKINHIVFEKYLIGSSWINQRWDSFKLVTPNKFNVLLPEDISFFKEATFATATEFSIYLKEFATKKNLPVFEAHKVDLVSQIDTEKGFSVQVSDDLDTIQVKAKIVVICSGYQNTKRVPVWANQANDNIHQIHSSDYKNTSSLSDGKVLVVGSGQSGVQIAEDLVLSDREVYLCTSKVGRLPRNYLGKDIVEQLKELGFYDVKKEEVSDINIFTSPQPQLSGDSKTRDVSLPYLEKIGVNLLGSLKIIENYVAQLNDDLIDNVVYSNKFAEKMTKLIREHVEPNEKNSEGTLSSEKYSVSEKMSSINLEKENITNIVWATGFKA